MDNPQYIQRYTVVEKECKDLIRILETNNSLNIYVKALQGGKDILEQKIRCLMCNRRFIPDKEHLVHKRTYKFLMKLSYKSMMDTKCLLSIRLLILTATLLIILGGEEVPLGE
jgi:hypothetical protein